MIAGRGGQPELVAGKMRYPLACLLLCGLMILTACSPSSASNSLSAAKEETNPFVVTTAKRSVTDAELAALPPGMRAIHERGKLRVAMPSADRKPFFYRDDGGRLAGSDVELAADVAAQMGVDVEYVRTASSFDEVVNQVASGQADIALSKLSATLPRAQKVMFSNPYLTLHQGLLLNRLALARLGSASADPMEHLRQTDIRIGVIAGTSYVSYAGLLFPKARIVQFPTPQEAMNAVLRGEVAAIYYDELQLKQLITDNPGDSIDLQLHIMQDQVDLIAVAVPPDDAQLLAWMNLYLQTNQARIDSLLKYYAVK
ncbi:amino acid ABC transporter substrate-binding protein [Paenibacillus rhizovicinus]|uniref:Amino acid ABC transporter substrate-binding protein n=1 Tax=Paenibacillus rhizovicinus TaxID=2704463 RepID=A0A6C0P6V4_9BACL|nr:ABC transporter substrate-binding protein [Paenibacillus rhizovicinus]QHW32322.1 amino acid ABC transporter substrate-binding protein [Paenibacillus rhizovicinus]